MCGYAKLALLIGSSYGGLQGTDGDVGQIASLLEGHGFPSANILRLINDKATRQNILDAWEDLICSTSDGDAAAIFYSGHGTSHCRDAAKDERECGPIPVFTTL